MVSNTIPRLYECEFADGTKFRVTAYDANDTQLQAMFEYRNFSPDNEMPQIKRIRAVLPQRTAEILQNIFSVGEDDE